MEHKEEEIAEFRDRIDLFGRRGFILMGLCLMTMTAFMAWRAAILFNTKYCAADEYPQLLGKSINDR